MTFTEGGELNRGHGGQTRASFICCMAIMLLFAAAACGPQPAGTSPEPATGHSESLVPIAPARAETVPDRPASETGLPPILFAAPTFNLTDQRGTSFGTDDLAGKVWVANFMF